MQKISEDTLWILDKADETPTKLPFCDLFPKDIHLEWNTENRFLSLLNTRESRILAQQQFTRNEWLLFMSLMQSYPHYASHEMLLAQLSLLSSSDWRQQLQEIRQLQPGAIVRELKPVYRALSGVRAKLKKLYPQLKITLVRNTGYIFTLASETKSKNIWS